MSGIFRCNWYRDIFITFHSYGCSNWQFQCPLWRESTLKIKKVGMGNYETCFTEKGMACEVRAFLPIRMYHLLNKSNAYSFCWVFSKVSKGHIWLKPRQFKFKFRKQKGLFTQGVGVIFLTIQTATSPTIWLMLPWNSHLLTINPWYFLHVRITIITNK